MPSFSFILCADDFGMTESVSRGLLDVALAGRISAASAMTSMPDWRRAAADWRAQGPDADLGLHVTLTAGAPLGPMAAFAPQGELPAIGAVARASLERKLPLLEIEAEIGRQIDAFCDAMGAAPVHVDGHQHVHVLPGVRDALFRALAQRGLGAIALRDSSDRVSRIARRRAMALKALKVNCLALGFRRAAARAGFCMNDGFAGFSRFSAAECGPALFASYLAFPGERHLVMCHPGLVDDALRRLDPVTDARIAERSFLLSDSFSTLLLHSGARLTRAERQP